MLHSLIWHKRSMCPPNNNLLSFFPKSFSNLISVPCRISLQSNYNNIRIIIIVYRLNSFINQLTFNIIRSQCPQVSKRKRLKRPQLKNILLSLFLSKSRINKQHLHKIHLFYSFSLQYSITKNIKIYFLKNQILLF